MKQLLLIFFLALGLLSFGQQDRFLFIQAQKDHPFYVRLGDKTYSSSSFGHLVIPSLTDKKYQLYIGFPKTVLPEQEFSVSISGKDRGLDLRIENGRSVFLYDWLSMELLRSSTPELAKSELNINGVKRTDPYARLMAGVVNDSLVLYTEKPKAKENTAVATIPAKVDSAITAKTEPDIQVKKIDSSLAKVEVADTASAITKNQPAVIDTQALAVENKPETVAGPIIVMIKEESTPDEKRITYRIEETKEEIAIAIPKDPEPVTASVKEVVEPKDSSAAVLMNSDCSKFATDSDVDKLRVQILKEGSDDEKVFAAKKMFRTRCFTTRQIIALTELFPSDEGRYMFFDAAYPFVSDSGNFKSLVRFLSNEYYINRFKALVRM